MTKAVLLNNVDHKDLRIVSRRGAGYGDNVMFATTFPAEFCPLQAYYPIVFSKTQDGLTFISNFRELIARKNALHADQR